MSDSQIITVIYKWRVRSGLLVALVGLVCAKPDAYTLLGGSAAAVIGLSLRTWACGNLKKEKELTISGPYKYTRNPLYLGNLFIGLGILIAAQSWWVLVFFFVYFLAFYPVVVHVEKKRMLDLFPDHYRKYSKEVPLFIPSLRRMSQSEHNGFSWDRFKGNRESRAIIGTAVYWMALTLKTMFF